MLLLILLVLKQGILQGYSCLVCRKEYTCVVVFNLPTTVYTRHDCARARSLPASPINPASAVLECGVLVEDDSVRRLAIWTGSSARSFSGSGLVSRSAAARPSHCCLLDATPIPGRCFLDTIPAAFVSVRVDCRWLKPLLFLALFLLLGLPLASLLRRLSLIT